MIPRNAAMALWASVHKTARRHYVARQAGPLVRLGSVAVLCVLGGFAARAHALAVEEASIADIQAAYRERRLSVHDLVTTYLARIATYDKQGPYINSIISVNPRALEEADLLDARFRATGQFVGPLHGVPIIIKDNIDVVGMPMTSGFQGWKNYYPPVDAPIVARIKAAGGIIIAKGSMSEFAKGGGDNINSVLPGFTRNPYNTVYATGGSSGGPAAALAANFAIAAVATDTGGSVRTPSGYNALVGIRPTVGLVSRRGIVPLDSARDTAGPMARCVADAAIVLGVIAGLDPDDPATARSKGHLRGSYLRSLNRDGLKGARLGVLRQIFRPELTDPAIISNFENTLAELREAGAVVVDPFVVPELGSLPQPPQTLARFKTDLNAWILRHPGIPYPSIEEIAASQLLHPLHQASFDQAVHSLPAEADPQTIQGRKDEELYRKAFAKAMLAARIDAIVFPTSTQLPPINGDRNTQIGDDPQPPPHAHPTHLNAGLGFLASTLQWPALSVPNGYIADGLPTGLQIVGREWEEFKIIQYAYAYEQRTHYRRPPPTAPPLR